METNLTSIHEDTGSIWPCSVGEGSGVAVSSGVGCRHGLDLVLWWLLCRLAAVALIRPLARDPPYAVGAALDRQTNNNNKQSFGLQT